MMFQRQKSIDELEEEGEKLDSEIGVARKRALLSELRRRGGDGFWKRFSSDGSQQGVNFRKVWEWLKSNR